MEANDPVPPVRSRLAELNLKAYYLLVALSFLYTSNSGARLLQWAIALTALVAVAPLQDLFRCMNWYGKWLEFARWFKIALLSAALGCTIWWIFGGHSASAVIGGPMKQSN